MLAKFSGLNPKRPYLSLEKENFCVVLKYSIKRESEIRKFQVAIVQQQLGNVQKGVMHAQSCSFAKVNLLLSCCCKNPLLLRSRNFLYHSNATSHFFSLFSLLLWYTFSGITYRHVEFSEPRVRPKQLLVFTWKSLQAPPG